MKCILINSTGGEVTLRENYGQFQRRIGIVPAGGKFTIRDGDLNSTYRALGISFDIILDSRTASFVSYDEIAEYSEISIQKRPDGAFFWEGIKSRESFDQDREAAHTSVKGVSLKFDEALRSCKDLEKLYGSAKICRHQCKHLLQTYKEGIQKMAHLYSSLIKDDVQIKMAYRDDRLTKVEKSLDSLEYIVCEMKELLNSCAKELGKVALVVSSRKPPVEKDMEVYSDFDMLVRELEWHLDVIEFLIGPQGQVMFEWSPTMCRYVLKREVVAQEKAPNQEKPRSFACVDREELQSGLEDGSIYIPNTIYGWCKRWLFGVSTLNATILKRCKTQDLQSRPMDLDAFEIDHLDLHPGGELGRGSAKIVYEGTWYEQSVAIATIKMADPDSDDSDDPDDANKPPTPSQIFRDEVKRLLQLQHPKVVSLFGWAETPDAPAPIKNAKDIDCVRGGYIVTEKMEYNLETVIKMRKKQGLLKGLGPFSNSVEIDILLQIVDAMLHVQNHGFMHRDLKPGNFLVNCRSSPARPDADTYYDVKLIDFGSSKVYVGEDGNTYNVGTAGFGPPELMPGPEKKALRGKYDMSVDVFSFGMTCYQVITGNIPFEGIGIIKRVRENERPKFRVTVLQDLKVLTAECWHNKPQIRPKSFKEIQERLWTIKMKLAVE